MTFDFNAFTLDFLESLTIIVVSIAIYFLTSWLLSKLRKSKTPAYKNKKVDSVCILASYPSEDQLKRGAQIYTGIELNIGNEYTQEQIEYVLYYIAIRTKMMRAFLESNKNLPNVRENGSKICVVESVISILGKKDAPKTIVMEEVRRGNDQ